MFSRKDQLLRKTGPDGIGRYDYLRLLKKEFNETNSEDAKSQILANLANFAYDPINYDYMRSLDLISLFLNELQSDNKDIVNFAASAVCNISSDPLNCQYIIRRNGIEDIRNLLTNSAEEIVLNLLATLYFIKKNISPDDAKTIFTSDLVIQIRNLQERSSSVRIRNLITVLLETQDVATGV